MLANLDGAWSHQVAPPGAPEMATVSLSRNESRTAFLSHWLTVHPAGVRSATRTSPLSRRSRAASTVSRTTPVVLWLTPWRSSQTASIALCISAVLSFNDIVVPSTDDEARGLVARIPRGCQSGGKFRLPPHLDTPR